MGKFWKSTEFQIKICLERCEKQLRAHSLFVVKSGESRLGKWHRKNDRFCGTSRRREISLQRELHGQTEIDQSTASIFLQLYRRWRLKNFCFVFLHLIWNVLSCKAFFSNFGWIFTDLIRKLKGLKIVCRCLTELTTFEVRNETNKIFDGKNHVDMISHSAMCARHLALRELLERSIFNEQAKFFGAKEKFQQKAEDSHLLQQNHKQVYN